MRKWLIVLTGLLLLSGIGWWFFSKPETYVAAARGQKMDLVFELDKDFEFGEYQFDLENADDADTDLCFCLTERNMFPPDCSGDVLYIYHGFPGVMCVPQKIGSGSCSDKEIKTLNYATTIYVPLEYKWGHKKDRIVVGLKIPERAAKGDRIAVQMNVYQRTGNDWKFYKRYTQYVKVSS